MDGLDFVNDKNSKATGRFGPGLFDQVSRRPMVKSKESDGCVNV